MNIAAVIVNRTNYSKLKPIILCLKNKYGIAIKVVASSGSIVNKVGDVLTDITKDNIIVQHKIECLLANDSTESMVKTAGVSLSEHAGFFSNYNISNIIIVGDRFDALSPAIAARFMNIPIIHIQGGEMSGTIDDYVRDLISICSTRHYVATEAAYKRVFELTKSDTIFNFGCPAVEYISNINVGDFFDVSKLRKRFRNSIDIKPHEPYLLIAAHPNTIIDDDIDMNAILEAVLSFNMKIIVLYPNIDAFNSKISSPIFDHKYQLIRIKHMPIEDFTCVMAHAKCMIGNSSSGIREAATFGTPVVNIGNRQQRREQNQNVLNCHTDKISVQNTIKKAMNLTRIKSNLYYKKDSIHNICQNIYQFLNNTK